jgi:hypothetical protein
MKKKNIVLSSIIGIICLIVGFLIGISVDFPKVKESELAGTIGKLDKYRNVKLSEEDLKLRSELFTDSVLRNAYIRFFSMNYSFYLQMSADINYSLGAIKNSPDFTKNYENEIKGMESFAGLIDIKQPDILMAIVALNNPSEEDSKLILQTIENAKSSITRLLQMESTLIEIIDAMEIYIENSPTDFNEELKKAHDLLTENKMVSAKAYKDRVMIKYLDSKKTFITDPDIIKQLRIKNKIEIEKLQSNEFGMVFDVGMVFDNELINNDTDISNLLDQYSSGDITRYLGFIIASDKFNLNKIND